jgi:hypothetical protein
LNGDCGWSQVVAVGQLARAVLAIILVRSEVKHLLLGTAALALVSAEYLSPALAQGPKPSGGNAWPGISELVDTGSSHALKTTAHYEYQYGYDHHGRWRGQWILVR